MSQSREFTPRDFFQLVKELNEHEAELKNRSAKDLAETATNQISSTRRP